MITRRRAIVLRLRNQGYSVDDIILACQKAGYDASERTINRDFSSIKSEGARWFIRNGKLQERIKNFLWDEVSDLLELRHQIWGEFHAAHKQEATHKDQQARSMFSRDIITVHRELHRILGLVGINLRQIQEIEQIDNLAEEVAALRALRESQGRTFGNGL